MPTSQPRRLARRAAVVPFALAALCACASGRASAPDAAVAETPTPVAAASGSGDIRSMSGRFTPMLSNSSGIGSEKQRLFGDALVRATSRTDVYSVELNVSSPRGAENLGWSILPGRCGAASIPLVQPTTVAPLEVRGTGSGELKGEIPVRLNRGGQYHINLYSGGGARLEQVVACANLRN